VQTPTLTGMTSLSWPAELVASDFVRLTTYRRNGEAVSTAVWFVASRGPDADELVVTTMSSTGKIKRIRHTDRMLVAACTRRGTPTGPDLEAYASIVTGAESAAVFDQVRDRYGAQAGFFEFTGKVLARVGRKDRGDRVGIRLVRTDSSAA